MIGKVSLTTFKGCNGYKARDLYNKLIERHKNPNCMDCNEEDIKNIALNLTPEEIVDAYEGLEQYKRDSKLDIRA